MKAPRTPSIFDPLPVTMACIRTSIADAAERQRRSRVERIRDVPIAGRAAAS